MIKKEGQKESKIICWHEESVGLDGEEENDFLCALVWERILIHWNTNPSRRIPWARRGNCNWVWNLALSLGLWDRCLGQTNFKRGKEQGQKKQAEIHSVKRGLKRDGKNGYNLVLSPLDSQRLLWPQPASVRIFIQLLFTTPEQNFNSSLAPSACAVLSTHPSWGSWGGAAQGALRNSCDHL